jgi:hypothetical protein
MWDLPLIKPFLILLTLGIGASYIAFVRSRATDRLLILLALLAAIVMILFPDLSSRLASLLGVGRGVDLIFYLFIGLAGFAFIVLHSRLQDADRRITELARAVALFTAREGTPKTSEGGMKPAP